MHHHVVKVFIKNDPRLTDSRLVSYQCGNGEIVQVGRYLPDEARAFGAAYAIERMSRLIGRGDVDVSAGGMSISVEFQEVAEPRSFDKDMAFEAEFQTHLASEKHKAAQRFYIDSIKAAALRRHEVERLGTDVGPLKSEARTNWITEMFFDFLVDALASHAILDAPLDRVVTDIEHAMLVMFPGESTLSAKRRF